MASSHVWIGNDLLAQDEAFWDMAKKHFDASLTMRESVLGKSHPEVAWSSMSLSEWYEKKNNIQEAHDRVLQLKNALQKQSYCIFFL